jgi:outer membrane protein OmpA-like peptidoglycan-associated protein
MMSAIRGLAAALPITCFAVPAHAHSAGLPSSSAGQNQRTVRAIQYPFQDGQTLIGFRGTGLDASAEGEANLHGRGGRLRIRAHFRNLGPANRLGPEYMTYVLWSVSPSGRCANLGEVIPLRGRARLETFTAEPTFALVLTAEPHFAVTRMSQSLVLENVPLRRTRRSAGEVEARLNLQARAIYSLDPAPGSAEGSARVSPYVFQARNALRIARLDEAEAMAPTEFQRAQEHADRMEAEKSLASPGAVLWARRAIQQAEDARLIAERNREARRLEQQREQAAAAQVLAEAAQARAEAGERLAEEEARKAHSQERAAVEARRKASAVQLALRRTLLERMNRLLRTQETEEGLQATLTDVAFPSGASRLSAPARENLAKVAGILLAHPGLKVKLLGHTDATGSPVFNARLSRDRAEEVRRFLAGQGLPDAALEATGMGSSHPVDTNATPQGRRRNRRVDLMISGEPIGL